MLISRMPEIEIPKENPFENDKLNRKPCADIFCSLVRMYSSTGCVIALDGEWGTGKTTFVKMLKQKMENEGGHPLYFNAWENDYLFDPLIALLAELKDLSPNSTKLQRVIANAGKILTGMATSFFKTKFGIDSDVMKTSIDEIDKILKHDIDEYAKQKTTFAEFRNTLQEYIADNTTDNLPVVFFIDELDRCNPKFAVLVLERVKHLFDIPNVIFVLSVNKKQLGYAIQGYYGSSNIDTNNYLRRFIDIEYSLPQPKGDDIWQYLYGIYNFDEFFNNQDRKRYNESGDDKQNFTDIISILVPLSNLNIRSLDKLFAHTRLALMSFGNNNRINPTVFFLLCYIKIASPELYHNILDEKLTAQELLTELEKFLPISLLIKNDSKFDSHQITYTLALFILMYNLDENGHEKEQIIEHNGGETITLISEHLDIDVFNEAFSFYHQRRHIGVTSMRHLTKKIELQEGFRM